MAKVGVQLAIGVPLDKAINNTLVSVAAQSTAPYIAQQIGSVISSPAMVKALTNVAITAETGILKGQSAEQIGQAMTMTAIYSASPVIKEWTSTPAVAADPNLVTNPNVARMGNGSPSGLSPYDPSSPTFVGPPMPANGITSPVEPYGPIESSPLDAATTTPVEPPGVIESSPLDNFDYSTLPQPDQSAPPEPAWTPPVVTDFKPDYSLNTGITTNPGVDPETGTGLTTPALPTDLSNWTPPSNYTPDYNLYDPATDPNSGLGLQMPEAPAIKGMGGGQGLTVDTTAPDGSTGNVGALGYTPDNATPSLGDPNSFINNPDVTGQPTMASDPAYDDPFSWFKSSGGLGGMDLSTGNTGNTGSAGSSSSKTSSSPLGNTVNAKVAQSYLQGIAPEAAPSDLQMAQLQQLYPTITPDLSKILLDRGMLLTPQNANVDFGSINQPMQDLNKVGSDTLSAADLANFGQQFAKGGNVQLPKGHHPEFITGKTGHYAQGRGTGQSDDIPAVLYAGDYVMDADTVAALGDGSSKAGAGALEQFRQSIPVSNSSGGQQIPAKIADSEYVFPNGFVTALGSGSNKQGSKMLDAMREQIRAHKRSAPETKIPPKARSPLQYMREAMKG